MNRRFFPARTRKAVESLLFQDDKLIACETRDTMLLELLDANLAGHDVGYYES